MMSAVANDPGQEILSLTIRDTSSLYTAYMPFIKNGGLFIPTTKHYRLGDEVFLVLSLMDAKEKLPVAGKVVWITPPSAVGNRSMSLKRTPIPAVGATRGKIETLLANLLKSGRQTHTT
jgi:type IV pilus assembly protein PilZ